MRFFKSCRRVKRTRAREMLFRVCCFWLIYIAGPPAAPGNRRELCSRNPPRTLSPKRTPDRAQRTLRQQYQGDPRYGVGGSRLESCPQLSITERQV